MSLGIFSFDLAAIINSLSNFIDVADDAPLTVANDATLEKIEEVLEDLKTSDSKTEDILMAAALANTVTPIIANESAKKEAVKIAPKTFVPVRAVTLDDETRREIERLIKSLQTSVVHNYRDADIIKETVSLKNVTDFPKRETPQRRDEKSDKIREERRREDLKLESLRDDLKRARLKNNLEG
jgi:hypothetical protein